MAALEAQGCGETPEIGEQAQRVGRSVHEEVGGGERVHGTSFAVVYGDGESAGLADHREHLTVVVAIPSKT